MGRKNGDMDRLAETWTRIAHGRPVSDEVSYRQAVRILADRLAVLVRPGEARRPYVLAMLQEGYRRTTAHNVVNKAFLLAAERVARTTSRTRSRMPETARASRRAGAPAYAANTPRPASRHENPATASPASDTKPPRPHRAPLPADPLHYGKYGQPAFGATPWRYFQDNPKLPLYASAAYPMSNVGVPVLDVHNWVAPYGVDDTGTPLAPYGVTHRYGYPVRREGVPPGSPLPSPKTHATGEEGWEDW